nr:exocyst complex component EXO70B1-like [Tanacetum cinerariifolium]
GRIIDEMDKDDVVTLMDNIEEVQRIEWKVLDEKMNKWIQAVNVVVKVCDVVVEFGEAVVIGQRSSEKLFWILDMYDVVDNVMVDFEMFGDESGELVCNEVKVVLSGLGEAAIGTFVKFENAVKGENSKMALLGGEIHPLT